jgi:GTPase Era involved in 16S rRNA processing
MPIGNYAITKKKSKHAFNYNDSLDINFYDTRGFYDVENKINEDVKICLNIIKSIKKVDVFLFCIDSSQERLTKDDLNLVNLFKECFPDNKNFIIVLTKYNKLKDNTNKTYFIKTFIEDKLKFKYDKNYILTGKNNKILKVAPNYHWKNELFKLIIKTSNTYPSNEINYRKVFEIKNNIGVAIEQGCNIL